MLKSMQKLPVIYQYTKKKRNPINRAFTTSILRLLLYEHYDTLKQQHLNSIPVQLNKVNIKQHTFTTVKSKQNYSNLFHSNISG